MLTACRTCANVDQKTDKKVNKIKIAEVLHERQTAAVVIKKFQQNSPVCCVSSNAILCSSNTETAYNRNFYQSMSIIDTNY